MGKNQSASNLTNVIQVSSTGNVLFVSGSTTLMSISSSGAITTTGVISGSNALSASYASASTSASYSSNADALASSFTAFSSSILAQTASFNAFSASIYTATSSFSGRVGALESYTASLNLKTASFATTGSNNFTAVQHIADTTNPTGFDTTASLYTEGGFGIKKDTYISSSLYIKGNLTVYGTQSVSYITSSQLNISTNLITVNTSTPSIRFGGLAVQDSGSAGGLTGSLLWDSQNNSWLYNNPSGSGNYDSSLVIMGPRNSSTLGNEVGLSCNYLIQGHGHHHTTSSGIFHDGTNTCIPNTLIGNVICAGTLCSNNAFYPGFSIGGNPVSAGTGATQVRFSNSGGDLYIGQEGSVGGNFYTGAKAYDNVLFTSCPINFIFAGSSKVYITSAGNVGIGTNTPCAKLDVSYSGTETGVRLVGGTGACCGNIFRSYIADYSDGSPINLFWANHGSPARTNTLVRIHTNETADGGYPLRITAQGSLCSPTCEALAINYQGKVGIGTTNPGYKLTVVTDSTAALLVQASNATVGSPILDFYDNGRSQETVITSTDDTTIGTYIASYSNHPLMFGANAGLSPTAKMVIATNGKVGIGESSPDNTYQGLTIKGSDPSLRLKTTGGSGWTWIEYVNSSGCNNFSMGVNQTSPYFGIKAGSGMDNVHFLMNSSGNIGMGEAASTIARLNVNGSTKMNRSFYNWYQGYWVGNSTYWHIKTGMWAGGSPNGNIQYTMSLFKGFYYSYSASILEGAVGFHNWVGTIYSLKTTGNLFSNVYTSSDGYVVLVIPSGDGETGVTIDWHQAYGYPFVSAQVTAAKLHGATTGGY